MPKEKRKESKVINMGIDAGIHADLERYCDETGLTKTSAVERILGKFFAAHFQGISEECETRKTESRKQLFASVPNIGEMFYHHIYLLYDEPQLFSCVTKTQQAYLVTTVPGGSGIDSWLAVPVSPERLAMLEKGRLEIRKAFTDPESILWEINRFSGKYSSSVCQPDKLPEEYLPERGEFLD